MTITLVCKYLARLECPGNGHTHRNALVCYRHASPFYMCKRCKTRRASYAYRCGVCQNYFCLSHYLYHMRLFNGCVVAGQFAACTIDHFSVLIKHCKKNFPSEKKKSRRSLCIWKHIKLAWNYFQPSSSQNDLWYH